MGRRSMKFSHVGCAFLGPVRFLTLGRLTFVWRCRERSQ